MSHGEGWAALGAGLSAQDRKGSGWVGSRDDHPPGPQPPPTHVGRLSGYSQEAEPIQLPRVCQGSVSGGGYHAEWRFRAPREYDHSTAKPWRAQDGKACVTQALSSGQLCSTFQEGASYPWPQFLGSKNIAYRYLLLLLHSLAAPPMPLDANSPVATSMADQLLTSPPKLQV